MPTVNEAWAASNRYGSLAKQDFEAGWAACEKRNETSNRKALRLARDALYGVYPSTQDFSSVAVWKDQCNQFDAAVIAVKAAIERGEKKWVGLTDEEALDCNGWSVSNIARNAEAKLQMKNI